MKRSELLIRVLLLPLDYISVLAAFLLAYQLRGSVDETFLLPYNEFIPLTLTLSILWIVCLSLLGVYNLTKQRSRWDEFFAIILGSLAAITVSGSVIFFFKQIDFSRLILVSTTVIAITLLVSLRLLRNIAMAILYKRGIAVRRTL
ncbi:hypothetical protein KC573_04435, partial [candidate division WWE3 bacterium]|nr:hypothetical protein [candidate division WWE3 bacterium]